VTLLIEFSHHSKCNSAGTRNALMIQMMKVDKGNREQIIQMRIVRTHLKNVVNHCDNVLNRLISRNVGHQVQKRPSTLHNREITSSQELSDVTVSNILLIFFMFRQSDIVTHNNIIISAALSTSASS